MTAYLSQNAFWGLLISAVEVYKRECFGLLIGYRDRRGPTEEESFIVEHALPVPERRPEAPRCGHEPPGASPDRAVPPQHPPALGDRRLPLAHHVGLQPGGQPPERHGPPGHGARERLRDRERERPAARGALELQRRRLALGHHRRSLLPAHRLHRERVRRAAPHADPLPLRDRASTRGRCGPSSRTAAAARIARRRVPKAQARSRPVCARSCPPA